MQVEEGRVLTPIGATGSERLDPKPEVDFDRARRFRDFFGICPWARP